jgi:two-component system, OmpR family, sensor kinase
VDGIKSRLNQSLQFRLSALNTIVIIVIALLGGTLSVITSYIEANEVQDAQLRQIASLINNNNIAITDSLTEQTYNTRYIDSETRLLIQPLAKAFYTKEHQGDAIKWVFDASLPNGIQTVTQNHKTWRVFVTQLNSGVRVAIAQDIDQRNEIMSDGALRTILPLVVLIPILIGMNIVVVQRMIRPIKRMASSVDQRSEHDLSIVRPEHIPHEIRPFIDAINRLLERVARSVEVQRRFVADAAHELRSPLTALSLQAEGLESCDLPDSAQLRVQRLREGLKRSRNLLEQLLSFARSQQQKAPETTELSIQQVFRQVIEDLIPLAEKKEIDLGVMCEMDILMTGNQTDLHTIIKNLVDNAIRYTPSNGTIDLDLTANLDDITIIVQDTGPGIPLEEQSRIFDPFYRILGNDAIGSGLGLSIVKTIVDRMHGSISINNIEKEGQISGLIVAITLPKTS